MARSLFIVTKDQPGLFAFVRKDFANDVDVDVILDRRVRERRQIPGRTPDDRRRADRRIRKNVSQQLARQGFAIVHGEGSASSPRA